VTHAELGEKHFDLAAQLLQQVDELAPDKG
jgi:hypothetical protein